jgi:two-component system sensor histidine kinase TctE
MFYKDNQRFGLRSGQDMRASSIKAQLLLWLLIPLFILSVLKLWASHSIARQRSQFNYDGMLHNAAESLAVRVGDNGKQLTLDFPDRAQEPFRHNDRDKFWYKISDVNGTFLLGSNFVPDIKPTNSNKPTFEYGAIDGKQVRIISLPYSLPNRDVVIEVAETVNARRDSVNTVFFSQIWLQFLVVAGGACAVWIGVNRGLAPLAEIEKAMSRRNPSDLRPLVLSNPPDELASLLRANNQLLDQLRGHLDAQKEFASNAAHQLRTPLTGLKTYVSIGSRLSHDPKLDEVFTQLNSGVDRMTQLVNRLLSLAREERKLRDEASYTVLDLSELASEAVADIVERAIEKKINLEFVPSEGPATIFGEADSIRELVDNILHNAIIYTPTAGEIKVTVECGDKVKLSVEDSGPGIPEEERSRVFRRFYRVLGSGAEGSGLGLAIVKEIADHHNASVIIGDGLADKGCKVTVILPKQDPDETLDLGANNARHASANERKLVTPAPARERDP